MFLWNWGSDVSLVKLVINQHALRCLCLSAYLGYAFELGMDVQCILSATVYDTAKIPVNFQIVVF
jgi:hypothetical protein